MLIMMAGLPGTGKTTLARELGRRLPAIILSKDTLRHALFPADLVEYSDRQDDFVVDLLLRTALYIWERDHTKAVILDGRTFSRSSQRRQVIDLANGTGQRWRIVECVCEDDVARSRLSVPDPDHPAVNRTPDLYQQVKARWEPICEEKIMVRTDEEIDFQALMERI
jgi:predicted kinase